MDEDRLERLVVRGDLDGLLRTVAEAVGAEDWAGLLRLRDACRFALETGRQLWPAAAFAEYRLALDGPGEWAARVLVEGTGQHTIGPLSEVAASSHTWAELAPHLEVGAVAAFVAHERVLRGEDLEADTAINRQVLDLPLVLAPWEPTYPVAVYHPDHVEAPPPERPRLVATVLPRQAEPVADDETRHALRELVAAWTSSSNGRVDLAATRGDHLSAIAALGVPEARVVEVAPAEAFAWMAWAGASGGAHGRRRGGAAGPLRRVVGDGRARRGAGRLAPTGRRGGRAGRGAALVRVGRLRACHRLAAPPGHLGPGRGSGLGRRRHRRATDQAIPSFSRAVGVKSTPQTRQFAGVRAAMIASREVRRRSRASPRPASSQHGPLRRVIVATSGYRCGSRPGSGGGTSGSPRRT